MISLNDLIANLEASPEGSRELDAEIAEALALPPVDAFRVHGLGDKLFAIGAYDYWDCPKFTTSLDAALTLVLEGYAVEQMMIWPRAISQCTVIETRLRGDKYWHSNEDGRWSATANTGPLAVCIAALRAREAMDA